MDRKRVHTFVQTAALAGILFTFPFRPFLINNLCIILFASNWLLEGDVKVKFRTIRKSKVVLLFAGLFLIMSVSALFSTNTKYAGFVLEQNLCILILPAILISSTLTAAQVRVSLFSFVAGCFLGMIICLGYALYRYSLSPQIHYFFYHDLSKSILGLHAVYYSLYIAFCILFLLFELEKNWHTWRGSNKSLTIALTLMMLGFVFLLSSKTIIIGLLGVMNAMFLSWIIKRSSRFLSGALLIGVLNIILAIGIFRIDYIKNRFEDSLRYNIEFIKKDTYSELTVFTGVTMRLTFWKFVVEILNERDKWVTGLTIGDAQDALTKKTIEKGLYGGNKEQGWTDYTSYNAHNQFIQYLLMMGVVGVLYFMILLGAIFWEGIIFRDMILVLTMVLFVLFCFTESVLAVNKGLIFFSIIPSLLISSRFFSSRQHRT